MRTNVTSRVAIVLLLIGATWSLSPFAGQPYPSLEGVDGLNVTYDVRSANPEKAALFLKLIQATYNDEDLRSLPRAPEFVVVFNAASITLVSADRERFRPEDRAHLEEIEKRVASMAAQGIRMEGCLTAAEIFDVDPKLLFDDIRTVQNAWISISGYQTRGFSIIPVY